MVTYCYDVGDLSCDDSAASLIVPAEEPQREYHSPNKEMNEGVQDCVVESSTEGITSHFTSTLQPVTALQSVFDQGHGNPNATKVTGTKVTRTKVTGIKLQGMKTAGNKNHSSRTNKRNKPTVDNSKQHKNKTKISVANTKPVAMERDKSSGELVTLTPNKVSTELKHQRLKSEKHKSPNSSFVDDVLHDGSSSKTDTISSVINITLSKTDQSSKIDQKTNKISISDQPSSTVDRPSSKINQKISVSDQSSSTVGRPSSQDIAMTTDKSIISVVVNKKTSHDSQASVTSRRSRSADSSVVKSVTTLCIFHCVIIMHSNCTTNSSSSSSSSTALGWQMDAIER